MKLFNFRAKVKIVGSIFFVAILLSVCVLGGTRIITDSSDNSVTFITNSNGGKWDATASNLQTAIEDAGTGGYVICPSDGITITNTIYVNYSYFTFYGNNLILTLSNSAGIQMMLEIQNANHVTVKDLCLDGNKPNNLGTSTYGIRLINTEYTTVANCKIEHMVGAGIQVRDTNNSWIYNNYIYDIGNGTSGVGIRLASAGNYGCNRNRIERNEIIETYEHGMKIYQSTARPNARMNNQILYNRIVKPNMGGGSAQGIDVESLGNSIEGNKVYLNASGNSGIIITNDNNTVVRNIVNYSYSLAKTGISISSNNNTVTDNFVYHNGSTGEGISIQNGKHNIVKGNHLINGFAVLKLYNDDATVTEYNIVSNNVLQGNRLLLGPGTVSNNFIVGNDLSLLSSGIISSCTGNNIIKDNPGFVTENYGTCTVTNGNTYVLVNHGLDVTPNIVMLAQNSTLGNANNTWRHSITSTQFNVTVNADPGQDITIQWWARLEP